MKTRFIEEIGVRVTLRVYWGDDCSNCLGGGRKGFHNAHKFIKDDLTKLVYDTDPNEYGRVDDFPDDQWPGKCDGCGALVPETATRQIFRDKLYNNPEGKPVPGDLFFIPYLDENHYWDNHKGPHLMAICPGGSQWNIDSRASNCTMPNDRNHRCWVRHGDPKTGTIHVDKNGFTCAAGAGSIAVDGYHGFLHNGNFT